MPDARLNAAIEALERQDWAGGISLLLPLIDTAHGTHTQKSEATTRALLAQALFETGQRADATEQARAALSAAERSDDRDTIHRCMALLASLELLNTDT